MTENDKYYLQNAINEGLVSGKCLEIGSAVEWSSIIPLMKSQSIDIYGLDMCNGKYVDFIINLESEYEIIKSTINETFDTIICFNTLEHVFNPVVVLENLANLLNKNGTLLISTPIMWPIHGYPSDFHRPLPNFYEEFARRYKFEILPKSFEYLGYGSISKYRGEGKTGFPPPIHNRLKFLMGKLIHKIFNTFGREYLYPNHLAIAITLRKI